MTISYMWVTITLVLALEGLGVALLLIILAGNGLNLLNLPLMEGAALKYAYAVTLQTNGVVLNPHTTFQPGQPDSLTPPQDDISGYRMHITYMPAPPIDSGSSRFALLVAPNGQIVASSSPYLYPNNTLIRQVLPEATPFIMHALVKGVSEVSTEPVSGTLAVHVMRIMEIIWSRQHTPIGAIYIQNTTGIDSIQPVMGLLLLSGLIILVITTPIGGLFGLLTTHGVVRRIRHLVSATAHFANGNYDQRVRVTRNDEVSQLEQHFNQMAQQLAESIATREELARRNARLEERARISRELHDAISQDLFSLRTLADGLHEAIRAGSQVTTLQPHAALLEQTTITMTREMRALLLEMRPPNLDGLDLDEALEELAYTYTVRLGIAVTTTLSPVALGPQTEQTLLRITQEALTNAARHACATAITLSLTREKQMVVLTIADNGQGFDLNESAKMHGLGLGLMQERIRELHGHFSLATAPGQGTRITVSAPQEDLDDSRSHR
ncbi:MAG: HAMP domain-containing protein [Chloroflexota bacterium]|nr:HAMP domain-containing protein [Chloroflexota bacterium]